LKLARCVRQRRDRGDPNGNRSRRAVSSDTADKQCHDGRKRYMFAAATLEGGIDGKRCSANARAYRDNLSERRGQNNLSEEAAVAGGQLRPTCICGYFHNLSALLQSNRPCTKLAWRTYNRYVRHPLVYVARVSTLYREV